MSKVKIITDSTSDLPQQLIEQYDITVLPMVVNFGNEGYLDGVDITPSDFYAKIRKFDGFPTTSQVNPGVFADAYRELSKETDVIISVIVSSELSGTFNSAMMAKQMVEEELDVQVICYDSGMVALGLGFMVVEAAKAAQEGLDPDEVLHRLDKVRETLAIYFAVPNLEHLERGGRIGKATALLGGLLNIVPLLTIEEGVVSPKEKIRGQKRILKRMTELVSEAIEQFGGKENLVLGILHTDHLEAAQELARHVKETLGVEDLLISEVGPAIGTHTGPGVTAIVFYKKIS